MPSIRRGTSFILKRYAKTTICQQKINILYGMVETCQVFWKKNGQQKRAERRKKGTSVEELIKK